MEKFSIPADVYQNTGQGNSPAWESDAGTLNDIQQKLRFASREILLMENEGGPALSEEETTKVYENFQLAKHVKNIFFNARARRALHKSK